MEHAFWAGRWSEGRIGFHRAEPDASLVRYADHLGGGAAATVLVPLCGKSTDLVFLRGRFGRVVGVEFVDPACEAFFAERGVDPEVTEIGGARRREADGICLLRADFFATTAALIGRADAVYDRAALIALPPARRVAYAAHLATLLAPGARGLSITLTHDAVDDAGAPSGPPFSVPDAEFEATFGLAFRVERLATEAVTDLPTAMADSVVTSSVWALERRG